MIRGVLKRANAAAVVILAPVLVHYLEAQRNQGLTRSLDEVAKYGASWQDYLSATGNLHYRTWSGPLWRGMMCRWTWKTR